jgi:protein TonB
MNSNSILTSNLLDIIFENRNKDYGAYVLRKNYNIRLFKSLAMALSFVFLFVSILMFMRENVSGNSEIIRPATDVNIQPPPSIEKPFKPKENIQSQSKHSKSSTDKPVVVKDFPQQKETFELPQTSNNRNEGTAPSLAGSDLTVSAPVEPIKPIQAVAAVDKTIAQSSPDIPPQYPGGVKELLKFLKRNLNTPQELQDEQVVAVKVKFVVSYTGDLKGFEVIETGGESFDNEVLRVLNKMPKWIPGKTAGEDVSAYFIVPVKFTVSY